MTVQTRDTGHVPGQPSLLMWSPQVFAIVSLQRNGLADFKLAVVSSLCYPHICSPSSSAASPSYVTAGAGMRHLQPLTVAGTSPHLWIDFTASFKLPLRAGLTQLHREGRALWRTASFTTLCFRNVDAEKRTRLTRNSPEITNPAQKMNRETQRHSIPARMLE